MFIANSRTPVRRIRTLRGLGDDFTDFSTPSTPVDLSYLSTDVAPAPYQFPGTSSAPATSVPQADTSSSGSGLDFSSLLKVVPSLVNTAATYALTSQAITARTSPTVPTATNPAYSPVYSSVPGATPGYAASLTSAVSSSNTTLIALGIAALLLFAGLSRRKGKEHADDI